MTRNILRGIAVASCLLLAAAPAAAAAQKAGYSKDEIVSKAEAFFGSTTEGLAKAIQKVFADHGRPNAIITGEEFGAAIGIGVRYGKGTLTRKGRRPLKVFWQGPSIGFDLGGNASKVFTLIYHLGASGSLFQRFPSAEGNIYFVAGVGVNYLQSGKIILAPIRTGLGLRAGASVGYLHFTREHSWLPL